MPNFSVSASTARSLADGANSATLNKRGEIVNMPWPFKLGLEGKVWVASAGTVSAVVSAIQTGITANRYELLVRVPSNVVVMPLYMKYIVEVSGGALTEGVGITAQNDVGAGTSTAVTPINVLSSKGSASSACTVHRTSNGDHTAATNIMEFWRFSYPIDMDSAAGVPAGFEWSANNAAFVPVVVGPGSLGLMAGTTTSSSYYASIAWAEFASGELI